MKIDEERAEFNARSEATVDEYLRSKTWVEKIESIERMRAFGKIAREAMKKTLSEQTESSVHTSSASE